jgi:peptidoglycan hydrolase-like protein with peptidoglycan-binding domain
LSIQTPSSEKPYILEVQEALKQTGYYRGDCSGVFDEKTAQAVRSFQEKSGLAPDGVVRYHVWLKLAAELEKATVSKELSPPSGEVSVVIDTFRRKLIVLSDSAPYAQFPIAIGKAETPSPIGNWTVINKASGWGTGFGTRWLGLNVPWGIYGIHGTNRPWSIGSMASHGCFRMRNTDVERIYPWIKTGTRVFVVGNPFGYMSGGIQRLNRGDNNAAVRYVQEKLKRRGFYNHEPDGMFGRISERAVLQFQKKYNLEQTGQFGTREYEILGLW